MRKNYLLLFILLSFYKPAQAQGNGEFFGLHNWSARNGEYNVSGWGGGIIGLCDTITFAKEKNSYSPKFQFGLGFYYSQLGSKTLSDVRLAAPRHDSSEVSVINENAAIFALARCISGHQDRLFLPYFDFLCGYRFFGTSMNITPYHELTGYDKSSFSFPATASGFMIGAGIGFHTQTRFRKTYILFDSELIWTYSPVNGTIANLSSLHPDQDGVYMEFPDASKNIALLKIGICFKDCTDSSEYDSYSVSHSTHYSGGGSHSSGGAHNSVHVNSGGHHGGYAK